MLKHTLHVTDRKCEIVYLNAFQLTRIDARIEYYLFCKKCNYPIVTKVVHVIMDKANSKYQ